MTNIDLTPIMSFWMNFNDMATCHMVHDMDHMIF